MFKIWAHLLQGMLQMDVPRRACSQLAREREVEIIASDVESACKRRRWRGRWRKEDDIMEKGRGIYTGIKSLDRILSPYLACDGEAESDY